MEGLYWGCMRKRLTAHRPISPSCMASHTPCSYSYSPSSQTARPSSPNSADPTRAYTHLSPPDSTVPAEHRPPPQVETRF